MKSVGIDIGSYSIKVVEVLGTAKGFHINKFYEHPLSMTAGSDQELEILEFLRTLMQGYVANQTRFVVGLKQEKVAIRNKTFPFSDRTKIAKSLAFELEEDIPFSAENAIFDAKIIKTLGSSAEVLACAAPKHHIQSLLQQSRDCGFEPYLISPEGVVFANFLEKWNEPPPSVSAPSIADDEAFKPIRQVSIVLNIGHTRTLVCAIEKDSLIAVRSILWGGKNIAEAISKKYEIPFIEAIKELQTKAFILTSRKGATFDQIAFSDLIAKSVQELLRDLQLYLLELKSEFNADVTTLLLSGGASQIANLGPFLTQMLEIPANRINTLNSFSNIHFDVSQKVDSVIGTALGLAIEGLKKPRNPPLTFLRGEFTPQNKAILEFWEKWGHSIKTASALAITFFTYSYLREELALRLADRSAEAVKIQAKNVARLTGKNATESAVRKYIQQNKKRAADLKTLTHLARMNSALDIVKKVSEIIPAKSAITLDVKNLILEDSKLTIEGYVNSFEESKSLEKALLNISQNGKIQSPPPKLPAVGGKVLFSYEVNVDRGIERITK